MSQEAGGAVRGSTLHRAVMYLVICQRESAAKAIGLHSKGAADTALITH